MRSCAPTSKEELQSINEELQTVNAELKNKLDEISHAHSDLQNFMAATEGGTLFLDRELRINRFTRPVTDLINVKSSDRGRPITDFTHRLNYATLERDAQRVLDELTTVEQEVESSAGRAFLIRLRPYRTVDNHINGVVVTFVDVTDRRQAQQQVRRERDYAQHIIDTVREGLVVLTPELRLLSASNAFYRHFQMQQAEIEGRLLYELGNGQWDLPELRTLLEEVLPQNRVFEDYVVNATFDGIGERTMLLNARRIDDMQRILLAIEDITDRPVIDASLRAAERRYRALAEATSDALYRLNADATTVVEADLANGHAPVAAPDLPLSWLQEQVHPDDQAAAQAAWRKARNSQAPFAIEHRLKDADGNWRWLFARAVPVRDETGTVIEWIGAATDITAHKADEEGWQIAGEGFHHALQHSPVVFARVDTDLRYQWLFHPHADFDIKEALGKRDDELSSAPGIAELIHLKEQTLALGEQQRAEITFLLSDGYHIYDVTATPIFNAAGEATGLLTAGFDVTAHKAAEAALQASKERYQALFAAIDEAFVLCESVLDATGQPIDYRLIEANPAFAKMTGVSPAAVQGRTVRELLPDTGEWWVESCRRVALRGEAERIEKQITAQGRWYTIYLFACGAGQVALLFSDISERRQNEQTLRHFNERLETRVAERTAQLRALAAALTVAEQAERQRLARVLHDDLQQLLYALRMRATLCIESATAAGMAELSASIQEIYDWLGDSITLTRQLTVDLSPPILEQKGLVEALQWLVAHVAERYGLQVALQTPAAVPVVEEEMRVLIFQTVSELLFNIFKHAGTKEATITVQTETVQPDREQQLEATVAESTPSEQLVIRVSDSGRGFDLATFEANDHQGFGLYHVRERLKFFGGRLEIATAPGAGTRLTIYAPVAN
jgi:PAS domain S-box-containing protein